MLKAFGITVPSKQPSFKQCQNIVPANAFHVQHHHHTKKINIQHVSSTRNDHNHRNTVCKLFYHKSLGRANCINRLQRLDDNRGSASGDYWSEVDRSEHVGSMSMRGFEPKMLIVRQGIPIARLINRGLGVLVYLRPLKHEQLGHYILHRTGVAA